MAHSATIALQPGEKDPAIKEIWRITIILSVLTIVELALGFSMIGMPVGTLHYFIKGVIIILMLAKAFYIIGYFMHLKHEVRTLIMSIGIPMLLFIWFILAFIMDGHSYNVMKNRYEPYYKEKSTIQMPPPAEEHQEAKPGGLD
ncbi:MAG: cytochrome C oxidase subunit IV family protein [Chitinophagaceae bacterium]